MQFLSDRVDAANSLMNDIQKDFIEIKRENEQLQMSNKLMSRELVELKDRVRNLEQYSRRNNVEISGIPATTNEDVNKIIQDVGTAIGMEVQKEDITAAHRIPTYKKERIPSVVVQFRERSLRDTWISKWKETKTLNAYQVNKHFPQNQRVYVNEHLSPDNKLFLTTLKKKCRELNYAFVWCREGKFFY
ncbi:uncharacterized protein LOC124363418 [Homalodisca vitripennis]|uniref:uncharacterized protein LOC124363418 n=1 Tax=Homalodisca vitripennis TaxID=197043 RepID=UPI001EEA9A87|nr:uncharacterized protein LOC124363418 [Homalodisca vitripennis]